MDFATAVKTVVMEKYAKFDGRAMRSEYWWWILFVFAGSIVLGIVDYILGVQLLGSIFSLATLIPGLAVSARRLHDIGRSGWWILIAFTIIGILLLIYWYIQPSDPRTNEYGPAPIA